MQHGKEPALLTPPRRARTTHRRGLPEDGPLGQIRARRLAIPERPGKLRESERTDFVRVHKSLRVTPAMAADVETRLWSLEELVEQTSR
jgi:hypothetical protein